MNLSLKKHILESKKLFPFDELSRVELVLACMLYADMVFHKRLPEKIEHKLPIKLHTINVFLSLAFKLPSLEASKYSLPVDERNLTAFITKLLELLANEIISSDSLVDAVKFTHIDSKFSFSIPTEVCDLAKLILGEAQSIYCPFSKGGDFAYHLFGHSSIVCETDSKSDIYYTQSLRYFSNNGFEVKHNDPISKPSLIESGKFKQFDAALAMLPWGEKIKGKFDNDNWGRFPEASLLGEVYFLRHMLAHTSKRVVCFVSDTFLFRTSGGEKLFKLDIIEKNWLEGVISLPSGLLNKTSPPLSMMILNKQKQNENIQFVNAISDQFQEPLSKSKNQLKNANQIVSEFINFKNGLHSANVKVKTIKKNHYNLSPARYVTSKADEHLNDFLNKFKEAPLDELVTFSRPQSLANDEQASSVFYEYGLNNLNEINHLSGSARVVKIKTSRLERVKSNMIKPFDVLVVCRGAVGKVGFVPEDIPKNAVANQAFVILRIKEGCRRMTPQALFQYFKSEYGQYQLSSLATGTTSPSLASNDIKSLILPKFEKLHLGVLDNAHQKEMELQSQLDSVRKQMQNNSNDAFKSLPALTQ